ncbi:hypothetical protein D3C87_1715840 [compost metagenome]
MPRLVRQRDPDDIDGRKHDQHRGDQFQPADQRDAVEIDDRRQKRDIENHDLRVAECHGQSGEEHPCRRTAFRQFAVSSICSGKPHLPGEIEKIGDADPLDCDEDGLKTFGDGGKAGNRKG